MINIRLYFLILFFFVGIGGLLLFPEKKEILVKVTENGFEPNIISLNVGEKLIFLNEMDEEVWPASDPHPTHDRATFFDPRKSISPHTTFEVSFEEEGIYRFHDHLHVARTGVVLVGKENKIVYTTIEDCKNKEEEERESCLYEAIKYTADTVGVDAAFQLFASAYETGETLGCHWTSHLIGEQAYKAFLRGEEFEITKATAYCGYGFYHGFMEGLLRENPDKELALRFCEEVNKKVGGESILNCYHGIGHGFTEEPPPEYAWGSPDKMLEPALLVCANLFSENKVWYGSCASGAYTVLVSFMEKEKYGFSYDWERPFDFCLSEPEEVRDVCIGEFAPKLDARLHGDIEALARLVSQIEDTSLREAAIRSGLGGMMQDAIKEPTVLKYLSQCHLFGEFENICAKGIAWGLISHGEPKREWVRTEEECAREELKKETRDACLFYMLVRLHDIDKEGQFDPLCRQDEYRTMCEEAKIK